MSAAARIAAQAKINLFLHVGPRGADGYHSLETAFLRLDLADDVVVREAAGRSLDATGPEMPAGGLGPVERNLAYRAAGAYAGAAGWPDGFAIEIVKRIPVGGGLGGGSADAGGVLRALETMSPRPLGERLVDLARGLGADVPFMTLASPMALGAGRGDVLTPIPALESRPILLAVPGFAVSTADAYAWIDEDRAVSARRGANGAAHSLATWSDVAVAAHNDFEAVVGRRHAEVPAIVAGLVAAGATIALLSGSGSAVFGVFGREADRKSFESMPGVRTIATRTSDQVEAVRLVR